MSHTLSQHALSTHDGVACGKKQLPAEIEPQSLHTVRARAAQSSSHFTSQHVGSNAQMVPQQASSEHPSPLFSLKQLPVAAAQTALISGIGVNAHSATAPWTQVKSQLTAQQNGSIEQTSSQHAKSLQPGVICTARHERFCPGIGVLFPHRHLGRLHTLSGAVARSAHGRSHCWSQQNGSIKQTASQQARSSQ
jgi:hypothetical protein